LPCSNFFPLRFGVPSMFGRFPSKAFSLLHSDRSQADVTRFFHLQPFLPPPTTSYSMVHAIHARNAHCHLFSTAAYRPALPPMPALFWTSFLRKSHLPLPFSDIASTSLLLLGFARLTYFLMVLHPLFQARAASFSSLPPCNPRRNLARFFSG